MTIKGARSRSGQDRPVAKVYIAFEGLHTEPNYFSKLKDLRYFDEVKWDILPRDYSEKNRSNVKHVFNFLNNHQYWIEAKDGTCPWNVFITCLVKSIKNKYDKLGDVIYKETSEKKEKHSTDRFLEIEKIHSELYDLMNIHKMLINGKYISVVEALPIVREYLRSQYLGYDFEDIIARDFESPEDCGNNHYAMVIDRDQRSNKTDQISTAVEKSKKLGYTVVITNPNFEFWVGLHLKKYNPDEMVESIRGMIRIQSGQMKKDGKKGSTGPYSYVKKRLHDYRKDYKFKFLSSKSIETAISRSQEYETNLDALMRELSVEDLSSVGTNMGDLFSVLRYGASER